MGEKADVRALRETLQAEVWELIGLQPGAPLRSILGPIIWAPTQRFAKIGARFDRDVAEFGLVEAAQRIAHRFMRRLEVSGSHWVPADGPLLIACNHAGTWDGVAIASSARREDLKIIVSGLPFLRLLPNAGKHFIYLPRTGTGERMTVLRKGIRHLRDGGALLIFPRGKVEPDPQVLPGAAQSLEKWSHSLGLIVRSVPDLSVIPAIISGMLSARTIRSPLTGLAKDPKDRQLVAEFVQVIQQIFMPSLTQLATRLTFGRPVQFEAGQRDAAALTEQVIRAARDLLDQHLPQRSQA